MDRAVLRPVQHERKEGEPIDPPPEPAPLGLDSAPRSRWPVLLGGALTAAMVVGIGRELFGSGLAGLGRIAPENGLFYLVFALFYLSPAAFDYVIFRRLWGIPIAGFFALVRKRIANDALLGYSGDAYFYAWARGRTRVAAPFGAVKDSMILSAVAGNAITLAMLAVALPVGWRLVTASQAHDLGWSVAAIVAISLPWLIFSRRVFSRPKRELWIVFAIHSARLMAGSALLALMWHFALPAVPIGIWLLLAAVRLLVSRLPLVPNKDLLFANFAIVLIGRGDAVSGLIAFTAALTLLVHVVLLAAMGLHALVARIGGAR
jgi:hypothetical protein